MKTYSPETLEELEIYLTLVCRNPQRVTELKVNDFVFCNTIPCIVYRVTKKYYKLKSFTDYKMVEQKTVFINGKPSKTYCPIDEKDAFWIYNNWEIFKSFMFNGMKNITIKELKND